MSTAIAIGADGAVIRDLFCSESHDRTHNHDRLTYSGSPLRTIR